MNFKYLMMPLLLIIGLTGTTNARSGVSDSLVHAVLKELSSDAYKGRMSGTPENKRAADYIASVYARMGMRPAVGNSFLVPFMVEGGDTLYNVCAIYEGQVDSFYAIGAHFDHIGHDDIGDDKIFNGADDNASGVAAMIGIADALRKGTLRYGLLLMAFNAEEIGLLGSGALVTQAGMDGLLKRTLVLFNMERW